LVLVDEVGVVVDVAVPCLRRRVGHGVHLADDVAPVGAHVGGGGKGAGHSDDRDTLRAIGSVAAGAVRPVLGPGHVGSPVRADAVPTVPTRRLSAGLPTPTMSVMEASSRPSAW